MGAETQQEDGTKQRVRNYMRTTMIVMRTRAHFIRVLCLSLMNCVPALTLAPQIDRLEQPQNTFVFRCLFGDMERLALHADAHIYS